MYLKYKQLWTLRILEPKFVYLPKLNFKLLRKPKFWTCLARKGSDGSIIFSGQREVNTPHTYHAHPSYYYILYLKNYIILIKSLMLHYSVKMFTMTKEDELQLGADGYLQKLFQRKTHQDKFWNGFIFTSLFFSLVSKNSLLNLFTIHF